MKEFTVDMVNTLISGICEGGISFLARNAALSFVPGGKVKLLANLAYHAGSFAFGSMVGESTGKYTMGKLDELKENVLIPLHIVKKDEVMEESDETVDSEE